MSVPGGLALAGLALLGIATPALSSGAISTAGSGGSVAISSPTALGPCQTAAGNCASITVPAAGPISSTFDTTAIPIVITDTGGTTLTSAALSMSTSANGPSGTALQDQLSMCLQGTGSTVIVNGPLSRGLSLTPSAVLTGPTLSPGTSTRYALSFYAGEDSACGHVVSSDPRTAAAWSSPPFAFTSSYSGTGTYVTPPSLTNTAENGTVKVTITIRLAGSVKVTPTTSPTSSSGGSTTGSSNSGNHNVPVATAASSSGLAFTGADIAAMTGGGLLIILLGLFLLLVSRRRRSQTTTGETAA